MTTPVKYFPEVRERAVRMVLEHQNTHSSQWAAIESIAGKIGYTAQTLRNWVYWYNHRRLLGLIGSHPASGSRSGLLSAASRSDQGDLTQTRRPPRAPGRIKAVVTQHA